jgi:hypothetical protein
MKIKALWCCLLFSLLLTAWAIAQPAVTPPDNAQPALYVVELSGASPAERMLALSLQGLANRQARLPRVYLRTGTDTDPLLDWDMHLQPGRQQTVSVPELLEKLRLIVQGQILCNLDNVNELNLATSLAGLRDAVVSDHDLGLPLLADLRGKAKTLQETYALAKKEILPKCSRTGLALLGAKLPFRDYVISNRLTALPLPETADTASWAELVKLLNTFPKGTPIYAASSADAPASLADWAHRQGYPLTVADQAANLSFHARFSLPFPLVPRQRYAELGPRIYVCFILSGGDDLGFAQGRMFDLWQDPARGRVPLGWAITPQLADITPDLAQKYFGGAYQSGTDSFVGALDQIARATPEAYAALSKDQAKLKLDSFVVADKGAVKLSSENLDRFVTQFQPAGVFVPDRKDISSHLVGNSVVMTKGFAADSGSAILTRLKALRPVSGGLLFVVADANRIATGELAGVASQLPAYFEVISPQQFLYLSKQVLQNHKQPQAFDTNVTLTAPSQAQPDTPITVSTAIAGANIQEALLVYNLADGPSFIAPMTKQSGDTYSATLAPLLHGGDWQMQVRISTADDKVAWSDPVTVSVAAQDADDDDLSRSEELLFATDPNNPDTDGDGILDGYDYDPLVVNYSRSCFLGPLQPGADGPYLVEAHNTTLVNDTRRFQADGYCIYRLRAQDLPAEAALTFVMHADGKAQVAFSADGKTFGDVVAPGEANGFQIVPVPGELAQQIFFVRISSATEAPQELVLIDFALLSPATAPSLITPMLTPPYPGPGLPVGISVEIWDPKGIKVDDKGVSEASVVYRSGRGYIRVALEKVDKGPRWIGILGSFENSRGLNWWIEATNNAGAKATSRVMHTWIGSLPGETISISANQELQGEWQPAQAGWGTARRADRENLRDAAPVQLSGGSYDIWILAGGRGRETGIWIDNSHFAQIDPNLPDGWQHLGRLRLSPGEHNFALVSGLGAKGSAACYSQLLATTIGSFRPPAQGMLQIANSMSLAQPRNGAQIGANTEVLGSAAGNIARVDFYVGDKLLRRFNSPPFSFVWNSAKLPEGKHTLRMVGFNRAGETINELAVEVEKIKEPAKP